MNRGGGARAGGGAFVSPAFFSHAPLQDARGYKLEQRYR